MLVSKMHAQNCVTSWTGNRVEKVIDTVAQFVMVARGTLTPLNAFLHTFRGHDALDALFRHAKSAKRIVLDRCATVINSSYFDGSRLACLPAHVFATILFMSFYDGAEPSGAEQNEIYNILVEFVRAARVQKQVLDDVNVSLFEVNAKAKSTVATRLADSQNAAVESSLSSRASPERRSKRRRVSQK